MSLKRTEKCEKELYRENKWNKSETKRKFTIDICTVIVYKINAQVILH